MAYTGNHPLKTEVKQNPHVKALMQKHKAVDDKLHELRMNPASRDEEIKRASHERFLINEQLLRYE